MVSVDEQFGANAGAGSCDCVEIRNNLGRFVQHRRHDRARRPIVDRLLEAFGNRVYRSRLHSDDVEESVLGQAIELPTHAVKFGVGRHDSRSLVQWKRRQKADDQLVCVLAECDVRRQRRRAVERIPDGLQRRAPRRVPICRPRTPRRRATPAAAPQTLRPATPDVNGR